MKVSWKMVCSILIPSFGLMMFPQTCDSQTHSGMCYFLWNISYFVSHLHHKDTYTDLHPCLFFCLLLWISHNFMTLFENLNLHFKDNLWVWLYATIYHKLHHKTAKHYIGIWGFPLIGCFHLKCAPAIEIGSYLYQM